MTNARLMMDRNIRSLNLLLEDVRKYPTLSREKESELGFNIRENIDRDESIDLLVKSNLLYIISEAKRYQTGRIEITELISQGCLGAIHAAKLFDYEKGFKFITYAKGWIKQYILTYITEHDGAFRLPSNRGYELSMVNKFKQEYYQENGYEPSNEEIADTLDIKMEYVKYYNETSSITSLDKMVGEDDGNSLYSIIEDDTIASPIDNLLEESTKIDINRFLAKLSHKEQLVIKMSFGIEYPEMGIDAIAYKLTMSKENIRIIKNKAITKLSKYAY